MINSSAKVDYQDFNDDSTEFIAKLKRVFADINIRIAAVENIKGMVDEFERRYGDVALGRIDAAIAPVLQDVVGMLAQARADLAEIDEFYRINGLERVDSIINPLIADVSATLAVADAKVIELNAFLAAKQSVSEKGQPNGYAGLDATGKVPADQLPNLVTPGTVGAVMAGANGLAAPADGDRFGGVLIGSSTMFWTTWGNIKATLKTYFDGIYPAIASVVPVGRSIAAGGLATGGGDLSANRTITVPKSTNAQALAGADDATAMTPLRTKEAIAALVSTPNYAAGNAALAYGSIGTYVLGARAGKVTTNQDTTVAGSAIAPAGMSFISGGAVSIVSNGPVLSGTWRVMGYTTAPNSADTSLTLFLRIS